MQAISLPVIPEGPTRESRLALGMQHHTAGRFDDAARIYQELHAADGADSEVLLLMGVLCQDLGLLEAACRFLEQALELVPRFPEARAQLLLVLNAQAQLDIGAGQLNEAERRVAAALKIAPEDASALRNLARIALLRGDPSAAEVRFMESLAHCPGHTETLNELGLAQFKLEKYGAAEVSLRAVLMLRPDHLQARNNLGLVLYQMGRLGEALACFETALLQEPSYRHARINLAVTLRVLGNLHAARVALDAVLADAPGDVEALNNLGVLLQDMGEAEGALEILTRAYQVSSQSPEVRWNLALSRLLAGDFRRGWELYESRWLGCEHLRGGYRFAADRAWQGEALRGKRILLWWEQGFGDTLQFIRFAKDLAGAGASVAVTVQRELLEIVRTAPGVSAVIAEGEESPAYDFHCPMLSLPYHLGIALDAAQLHGGSAYLSADPQRSREWGRRLGAAPGFKVGLVWAGNGRRQTRELRAIDQRRSIRLARLAPILAVEGCRFFSLQKGEGSAELRSGMGAIEDFSAEWADFADTAAFVANLDLIITVDTAVAHLAGALGRPVWLLNRHDTCWRWLRDREDSPWYGKLRQFRQVRWGEWDSVIARVAVALAEAAARSGAVSPAEATVRPEEASGHGQGEPN
jgi:Flp pilus assembly protein TadD